MRPGTARTSQFADEDRLTPAAAAAADDDDDDNDDDGRDADRLTTVDLGRDDGRGATCRPEVDSAAATGSAQVQ